jgi:hypothetical protein
MVIEFKDSNSMFLMGLSWFRSGEIVEKATREMTDVISIKQSKCSK